MTIARGCKITRRLEFDAGHRLVDHGGKCRNAHGHRYAFEVTVTADRLSDDGVIIDFADIKALVGGWIDDRLDHAYIGEARDPILQAAKEAGLKVHVVAFPPTVEWLVAYLLERSAALLAGRGLTVLSGRLYETPTCWADARR